MSKKKAHFSLWIFTTIASFRQKMCYCHPKYDEKIYYLMDIGYSYAFKNINKCWIQL